MSVDEFIITVFCLVEARLEELTSGVKRRTRGLAPRVSESEVITMEIVGEFWGYESEEAICQ